MREIGRTDSSWTSKTLQSNVAVLLKKTRWLVVTLALSLPPAARWGKGDSSRWSWCPCVWCTWSYSDSDTRTKPFWLWWWWWWTAWGGRMATRDGGNRSSSIEASIFWSGMRISGKEVKRRRAEDVVRTERDDDKWAKPEERDKKRYY